MTDASKPQIGGILLAAGGSNRLGRPKQLVKFQGKTLLRRAAEALVDSACNPVVVVLGAETEGSTAEIAGLSVAICVNENWQTGMSSSIRTGLQTLLGRAPALDAVMITLCDQPHVTSERLDQFTAAFRRTHANIVAADYEGIAGVPALFSREMFEALSMLEGDKGARDLIRSRSEGIITIALDAARIDIDTLDDLNAANTR